MVVVGGGVMGSAAAWALARRGVDVVLLERFGPGHAHGASHGRARIYRSTYAEPHHQALVAEARALWAELEEESGVRVLHPAPGVSTAGHSGLGRLREVAAAMTTAGVPHEWLPAAEAEQRWPGMRFPGPVLHEPATAGRIDADTAVTALQQAAAAHGAVIRHHRRVTAVEPDGDGVVVRSAAGAAVRARVAVVAAGAWTADVLSGLRLPPLRVTQEQPAHFRPLDAAAVWPAFTADPDPAEGWPSGVYGLASPGEGVKVGFHGTGPEVHPDRRDHHLPEPGRLAQLQEYVRQWLPGLDAESPEPVSCTYTSTPTGDFVLDRIGPVVVAAGFSGHGFKSATAVGRVLADLAVGAPADAEAFSLRSHAVLR